MSKSFFSKAADPSLNVIKEDSTMSALLNVFRDVERIPTNKDEELYSNT